MAKHLEHVFRIIKVEDSTYHYEPYWFDGIIINQTYREDNFFPNGKCSFFIASNKFGLRSAIEPELGSDYCYCWGEDTTKDEELLEFNDLKHAMQFNYAVYEYNILR